MRDPLPDEISLAWFIQNRKRVRDALHDTEKPTAIVGPEGQIAPVKTSRGSISKLADLRITETSADPESIAPPVLALTVDDADQELDLAWTLPETYSELFLERSTDGGSTWTPLATLPGTQDAYEDADVTPGTTYSYRIRGRVGGAYSAYSNIVSGELEEDEGCEYALPEDMGASTLFFQGFEAGDISDPPWTPPFPVTIPGGDTTGGYGWQAGNLAMSENGRVVIVTVPDGPGKEVRVITREDDNSFTVEELNTGGGDAGYLYNISRNGIIAGKIGSQGAVWLSGPTGSATTDASIRAWYRIGQDGTKLYGINTSDEAIERTIGGADVVIAEDCSSICGVSHCGDVVVVETNDNDEPIQVYKLISGTWTKTATLADHTGSASAYPLCCNITGDGTKAFGGNDDSGASARAYVWDLAGTGTITASTMGVPADITGLMYVTNVASSGNVVVGWYEGSLSGGEGLFWLASEGFATAHDLDDHLTGEGVTQIGEDSGEYISIDNVVCSADGTQFATRADVEGGARTIYFAACPTPT